MPGVSSGERENSGDDNCNLNDAPKLTPQMLKNSGIHKENAMNFPSESSMFAEKLSPVNPYNAIGGKEEPALIAVSLRNTLLSLSPPPTPLPSPTHKIYFHISS